MGEAGSVEILVERLREIGERCQRLAQRYPTEAALLEATRSGVERLANRLSAQAERCMGLGDGDSPVPGCRARETC